jgi:acylphosphatase
MHGDHGGLGRSYGGSVQHDPASGHPDAGRARLTAFVRGRVHGVGFRWWTRAQALELGLVGYAANLSDGRVQVVAEGGRAACDRLLELLDEQPTTTGRPGVVTGVTEQWSGARGAYDGFEER